MEDGRVVVLVSQLDPHTDRGGGLPVRKVFPGNNLGGKYRNYQLRSDREIISRINQRREFIITLVNSSIFPESTNNIHDIMIS